MTEVVSDIEDKPAQGLPFKATTTAVAVASFLAACGGGGSSTPAPPAVSDKITFATDYAAARFLQHAQFSRAPFQVLLG
jgi:hypothetical protein